VGRYTNRNGIKHIIMSSHRVERYIHVCKQRCTALVAAVGRYINRNGIKNIIMSSHRVERYNALIKYMNRKMKGF